MRIVFNDGTECVGELKAISTNVIQIVGNSIPENKKGFIADEEFDYSTFKTIYRVVEDGVQFSDDKSVWVEPTKDVIVSVSWENDNYSERPKSVELVVNDESVTLTEEYNWRKEYIGVPKSAPYVINSAEDVLGYEKEIYKTKVRYFVPNVEPNTQEQLDNLYDVVCELDERVYALEESEG